MASLSPIWIKISDFGISKRWVGTSLKTVCGTAIYSSPEQLGMLPHAYRSAGNSYTNNIDIWALGAIVHEMLTLEIPFLDKYSYRHPDLTLSVSPSAEQTVDTGLLYEYCKGANPFPCESLRTAGVTEDGIDFVKSLMVVNPTGRASAAVALASKWIQVRPTLQAEPPTPQADHAAVAGPSKATGPSEAAQYRATRQSMGPKGNKYPAARRQTPEPQKRGKIAVNEEKPTETREYISTIINTYRANVAKSNHRPISTNEDPYSSTRKNPSLPVTHGKQGARHPKRATVAAEETSAMIPEAETATPQEKMIHETIRPGEIVQWIDDPTKIEESTEVIAAAEAVPRYWRGRSTEAPPIQKTQDAPVTMSRMVIHEPSKQVSRSFYTDRGIPVRVESLHRNGQSVPPYRTTKKEITDTDGLGATHASIAEQKYPRRPETMVTPEATKNTALNLFRRDTTEVNMKGSQVSSPRNKPVTKTLPPLPDDPGQLYQRRGYKGMEIVPSQDQTQELPKPQSQHDTYSTDWGRGVNEEIQSAGRRTSSPVASASPPGMPSAYDSTGERGQYGQMRAEAQVKSRSQSNDSNGVT